MVENKSISLNRGANLLQLVWIILSINQCATRGLLNDTPPAHPSKSYGAFIDPCQLNGWLVGSTTRLHLQTPCLYYLITLLLMHPRFVVSRDQSNMSLFTWGWSVQVDCDPTQFIYITCIGLCKNWRRLQEYTQDIFIQYIDQCTY